MSESSDRDEQKTQFVESLLDSLYQNNREKAQSLVTAGLNQLEPKVDVKPDTQHRSIRWPRWKVFSLAASALILTALLIPNFFGQRSSALAAVAQSFEQSLMDIGRHYTLEATWRSSVPIEPNQSRRKADLYVKGSNHLAICTDGAFESKVWLGVDHGAAWVVPPIGPVIEGNEQGLLHWTASRKDITTPYLHVSSLLKRMSESYELEFAPDVVLQTNEHDVTCRHVVGKLTVDTSPALPARIDLWADADSGVAMKLIATWEPDEESRFSRESVKCIFQKNVELEDSFFSPGSHGGEGRTRIRFGSNLNGD